MGGYRQDPLQIINLIADNLRDRYQSGFPVLKEIIQNADDAGVTHGESICMEYGISPGIPDASHPLLAGPALFFINDGSFSLSDSIAIRSFGLNQKAMDDATIGKFGLGMKSVFHFCEAFFFMAHTDARIYQEIVNPWSVPPDALNDFHPVHNDWDNFNQQDADKILRHLDTILQATGKGFDKYFVLWIPLRQKKHLIANGQEVGNIAPEFPGDNLRSLAFLSYDKVVVKLADLFPLLRSIQKIRCWRSNTASQQFEIKFTIALKQGARRLKYPAVDAQSDIMGVVQWKNENNSNQSVELKFSGKEKQLTSPPLEKLRKSEFWPKSFVRDLNKIGQKTPDKAKAHCAAVFGCRKNEEPGSLQINWAVFLPVETASEEIPLKGNVSFRLTLHGYFFVDAGRTEIFGLQDFISAFPSPENENELRAQWNFILAKQGALPLILPALRNLVKTARLSQDMISDLCEAISLSNIFKSDREHVCRDYNLICRLRPEGPKWALAPRDKPVLTLPAPPSGDPRRPWEVFKKLSNLEKRFLFITNNAPHLMNRPDTNAWTPQLLIEIMDIDEQIVFQKQTLITYYKEFLNSSHVRNLLSDPAVRKHLSKILNRTFLIENSHLSPFKSIIQDILSFIRPQYRLPIPQCHPDVITRLRRCDIDVLLVPKAFDPGAEPGKAHLHTEDAEKLFREIDILVNRFEKYDDQKAVESCRILSQQILDHCPGELKTELSKRIQSYRILDSFDCKNNRRTALSIQQIRQGHDQGTIFLFSQGVNDAQRLGFADILQNIISDQVFLITNNTAGFVFGNIHKITPCDARGCLAFLGNNLHLLKNGADPEDLLKALAGVELNHPVLVKGMRYLLHGRPDKFEQTSALWAPGYSQQAVWEKMWRLLPSSGADNWNLLSRHRVDLIPQGKWSNLDIREIKASDIMLELKAIGVDCIDQQLFNEKERDEVLIAAENEKALWQKIPFHKTLSNQLVSIEWETTFLESDLALPDDLQAFVNVICRSPNDKILRLQEKYIRPLNETNLIKIILNCQQPYRYWQVIMNAFPKIKDEPQGNPELKKDLKTKKWLIDRKNSPIRPADVIHLEKLQDEVTRMVALSKGAYCDPFNLNESIQKHPNFSKLVENYFSKGDHGLQTLCLLINDCDKYAIGKIPLRQDSLEKTLHVLKDIPPEIGMPGWKLMSDIAGAYGLEKCERFIFQDLRKPIEMEKILALLVWLKEKHVRASFQNRKNIKSAFDLYLYIFAGHGNAETYLQQIELLNQKQQWRKADQLCIDVQGVDGDYVLDDEQKGIVKDVIQCSPESKRLAKKRQEEFEHDVYAAVKETSETLKNYFFDWEGLVPPEIICAFMSLLGDDPKVLKLAENYKGRHSIKGIREKLPWGERPANIEDTWMAGLTQHEALAKHRFIVRTVSSDTVEVISLTGKQIKAPLDQDFTSILVGKLWWEKRKDMLIFPKIHLRKLNPDSFSPEQLSALLKKSAELLLKDAYNQGNYNLENLWNELNKSEQLDISIARRLIMKHIPLYLRQLGIHRHPYLLKEVRNWNEARYRIEEYSNKPDKKKEFEDQETKALENIQNLIKKNEDVQAAIREAVRSKIRDFQYTPASIPFELFQNADDAVSELRAMKLFPAAGDMLQDSVIPDFARRFIVKKGAHHISFLHWGRQVNYIGGGDFPGREHGFHQDLEKMLLLSSSDKQSGCSVTGKFGLGFKSALLACDTPYIMSGRLNVKIIAGLFPERLQNNEANVGQLLLKEYQNDIKWPGTVIHLPEINDKMDEIGSQFERLSGIMTVFAKQIRQIEISAPSGIVICNAWQPYKIKEDPDVTIEFGALSIEELNNREMLYFRCKNGGLLVEMGPRGFRPLPSHVPSIWVVAPTREKGGLGFAINGDFEVDVGRSRLASDSLHNKKKAQELGQFIGKGLDILFLEAERDWNEICQKLKLEHGLSKYDFWFSVWNVLTHEWVNSAGNEVAEIAKYALSNSHGLAWFINQHAAMPNGLWGEFYKKLTKPGNVHYVLRGILTDESVFIHICEWPVFRNKITPESVISEPVYNILRKISSLFSQNDAQRQSLRLSQVINWLEENDNKVDFETAQILGRAIKPALFTDLNKTEIGENEAGQISKELERLKFKTRDGTWQPSQNILLGAKNISGGNDDEPRRAAFAPDNQVLSMEYDSDGIAFFMACREKLNAPVSQMLDWVLSADTDTKRILALQYLSDGELAHNLCEMLREKEIEGSWLSALTRESEYFHGWDETDIDELLYRKLKHIDALRPSPSFSDYNIIDPFEALTNIYSWWEKERHPYETKYVQATYPESRLPDLKMDEDGNFDRGAWLSVFLLGAFHTIGRTRLYQHRGFLELCQKKGWWATFTQKNPQKHADDWMAILEAYIDEQVDENEYEIWVNRFPTIYRFSRVLDEYVEAFYSIDRMDILTTLDEVLMPKSSSGYQGGGINVPPIKKTLGIGANFVVREMKRAGLLSRNEQVTKFCYVPTFRIRNLLIGLGCNGLERESRHIGQSKIIHAFLSDIIGEEKCNFKGAFDIPLQFVAEKVDLQIQLLGTTLDYNS